MQLVKQLSSVNPELKLENQASMSSIFNDPNANGNTVASLNGALGSDAAS